MEIDNKEFSPNDPNSFARPDLCVVTFMHLEFKLNFEQNILEGNVKYTAEKITPDVRELILDVKDLTIISIYMDDNRLSYKIRDNMSKIGSKLVINIPLRIKKEFNFNIKFITSPDASGLVWLTSEQTLDKKEAFLFSQGEAIHARSIFPCQDTPAIKTPFTASVKSPPTITALMSAIKIGTCRCGDYVTYKFEQKVPVPSYLIAIAAGLLESRSIGPRSKIWAEPGMIEKAAYEFAETETMIQTAEQICGPYVWGRYDLLVLPPAFSFGGMENPCLTFVSPTIIDGDRSLVFVVAHEISHSWTGNLVTNKNFEHFWLNEGFTVLVERKIVGRMKGPAMEDFEATTGIKSLQEAIDVLGETNPLTMLVPDLNGVDPEDAFSLVPYEKGYMFLRYLEKICGGPDKFEPFLRMYLDKYKYKSLDSDDFKNDYMAYFSSNDDTKQIDWDTWYKQPGMPPVIPEYDTTLSQICINLKDKWFSWNESDDGSSVFSQDDIANMDATQISYFLQLLWESEPIPISKLKVMDEIYKLGVSNNADIKFYWIRIGLKARWLDRVDDALTMVTEIGRVKYIRPIYQDLYNWEEVRPKAISTFLKNKQFMMYMSVYTVCKDLHLDEAQLENIHVK